MFRRQALYGALALLVTVLSAIGPASAQIVDAGAVSSPPEDAPQYIKGWEPKDAGSAAQDPDEGDIADTFLATHRSGKAAAVVGAMRRTDAIGTADLRHLLPGQPVKRNRERRENEGPTPHPVLLPGTEGSPSAVEQAPGGGLSPSLPHPAAPAPAPITTFDGLDYATWGAGHPPDNNGDVGPTYYISTVNTSIGIYSKSTGALAVGITFDNFMSQGSFGNLCDTDNFGDPVVVYDSFEDRWIITDFAFTTNASGVVNSNVYQCFAVSRSGDPVTGGWYYYSDVTSDVFPDYPKFGIWSDGLYRSSNNFGPGPAGSGFVGTRVWAYNKAQMYAGAAAVQIVQFDTPDTADFSLLPSNARLQAGTPPAGTPNYFVSLSEYLNSQNVYAFHVDWNRPSLSTFGLVATPLAGSSWANATPPTSPTPKNALDSLGIRAMMQNQYTNIGGVQSLWDSHTVRRTTTGSNVPRWYQINVSGGAVAANDVQSTNWDPDAADTNYRWMSSLAVDRAGNVALGYSLSNSTTNPKVMYAGRLAGDAANTFSQTEQTLFAGTGSQTGNCGASSCTRWGDYSAMTLDPDGCRFWYINEYYTTNDLNNRTRIGAFKYPSCTVVGNGGTISGAVTASPGGSPISGATVTLGSRVATTDALGFYSFTIPAGTYPLETASAGGYGPGSASSLVVTDSGTTTQNFALSAAPANVCYTDTTQSDFQTAALTNIDLASSLGDAILTSTSLLTDAKQETNSGSGFGFTNTGWTGQTFTALTTGQLSSADVYMFCSGCSGANPNITVSVRAVAGNLPTGADLASGTIAGFNDNAAGGFQKAIFGTPINVTAGTQYALVVRAVAARTGIYAYTVSNTTGANPYAGGRNATSTNSGSTWAGQTRSMVFHTYVTVPRTYSSSGDLVSNAKDANPAIGYTPTWSTLNWTGTTPASTTLRFQAAGSSVVTGPFNFVGPDGTAGTYFANGGSLSQFNGSRFVRYHAYLGTSNTAATSALSDVTLCSSNQPPTPVATKLAFTTQPPASSLVGAAFSTQVSVEDASGNVVTSDTSPVTLALSGGTGGATLGGTTTVNAVSGVATFANLSVDTAGTAYVLNASDASLTGAASNPFNIAPNTYTIGGSASGLTGSVSLKLDGTTPTSTQTQTFAANGSFTFTTPLQSGSGWTVSIATQPTGQTCAVTSGSGANLSANVTAVQVVCTTNTYTIGGSVTGLTTSGLVLAATAGSQTVTVPSGAASYQFPTAVPTGTAYTVSVQTQPTGQTCSVANASGTIANANVTNANVTCTTNLYSIGGSISGLTGSVLLKLDSTTPTTTQTQAFAANGSFTFASTLAFGSGWTVSIATQPTGQTCAVTSGSGANLSANVTTVQVTCTTNTYTIGGSLSGLTGSVSLKLDGTTPTSTHTQTFGASGSFTFTTPLQFGSGWTVSIATQPTGQTCAVTSGSGANLSANVTTVQVTCTTNTYTIGGSVSGLTGSVSLKLDGTTPTTTQTQPFAANGSFTFTTPLQFGSGWTVSIATQPTGQTCAVTSGSGANLSANVTTVQVTCTTNTYTIGGSVSGLTGSVSLKLDGTTPTSTQTQTFGANGSFTFTTSLQFGSGWTVSIATQPTGQTCAVTSGSGANLSANVTTVQVNCAVSSYLVSASVSGGNGTITPGSQNVNYNGTASFVITPSAAYHVVLPLGGTCSQGTLSGTTYVTGPIVGACSVIASFAPNPPDHLAFVAPPADVFRGDRLGGVQVAIVDDQGNVITTDSSSQITLSTAACGGSVTLEQATVSNGIATFAAGATPRFYTLANGKQMAATSGSYNANATFNVITGGELLFADDFEICRL
ncbi:MAG: carboxypeptidase-like regulatory domain-containing protein [Dokdonella sp.]